MPFFVLSLLLALVVAGAMALCGLACRWRRRPWWLCLWLFLSLPVVWVAVSVLLHFLCRSSADFALFRVLGPVIVMVTYATLLPFLVLSRANALFRERLKNLLHLR